MAPAQSAPPSPPHPRPLEPLLRPAQGAWDAPRPAPAPASCPAPGPAPAPDHYRRHAARSPPRHLYYPDPPRWPPAPEQVVLLMEDTRYAGPEPDYQLAEVTVHLRPGDDGDAWADGEEVIKALQATPSRLEGPAKVFARRGKYRQCFVRFADAGPMECQPSSLMVTRDKTIELIVEPNPESGPGAFRGYDYAPYGAYPSPHYAPPAKRPAEHDAPPAKRARPSPAPAGASSSSSGPPSAASAARPATAPAAAPAPTTRASSPESLAPDPHSPYAAVPAAAAAAAPPAPAPKEVVNAAIVAYLRAHIQTEDGYPDFAASKGRLLPIPDLLRGYRFAARVVGAWANRKTPPGAPGCASRRITKNHVLQALFRQTSWGSDCEQTLALADRYGRGGPREDARVVALLSGGAPLPERARAQGSVALLDFLKDVEREWRARDGPEDGRRSSGSAGGGRDEGESGREGD